MRFFMLTVVASLCLVACGDDATKAGGSGSGADIGGAGGSTMAGACDRTS